MPDMKYEGSLKISRHPGDRVEIDCAKCGRHGIYRKANLITKFGDIVLPDLLRMLASDCNIRSSLGNVGCGALFSILAKGVEGKKTKTPLDIAH